MAILLSVTDLAPRPGTGPAFLSAVLTNGTLFPLAALAIMLPLFLPAAVAVMAGESVAGEAQAGTLRYLLVRPVGRTRLLVAKLVASWSSSCWPCGRGGDGVRRRARCSSATHRSVATSVSGSPLTPEQCWRTCWRSPTPCLSMLGVAAIALFLSTSTDTPLGGRAGGAGAADRVDAAADAGRRPALQPYLPTRYWLSFVDLFRDPILWRDVVRGTAAAGGVRRGVPGRGLGQLHDQGHHDLSRPQSPAAERRDRARADLEPDGGHHHR